MRKAVLRELVRVLEAERDEARREAGWLRLLLACTSPELRAPR